MRVDRIYLTCGTCGGELVLTEIDYAISDTKIAVVVQGYCISCGTTNHYDYYDKVELDKHLLAKLKIRTGGGDEFKKLSRNGGSDEKK